ncbi:MAG: M55 family metallopeptidase [Eubacteriaceae bacterium]|nr:M55 family metallopeptidase [Eubacteriaceae bacterium]
MKVYISVDLEGITGVTDWPETELGNPEHAWASQQMTLETLAACEGAIAAGADEIFIKDAHDDGRNLNISNIPDCATVIRGWTLEPESMMAGIDSSFDAAVFIGYHDAAGSDKSPLAHTMNRDNCWVKINGKIAAEFDLNAYVAAEAGVPVVFVSGDEGICRHAKKMVPEIETVGVKYGVGEATFSMAPKKAVELIRKGVEEGLKKIEKCKLEIPEELVFEANFKEHAHAHRSAFYPGAEQIDEKTVRFVAKSVKEMMTARMFIL